MSSEPTIAELRASWDRSKRAWDRSADTDHVQIIRLGEDLYADAGNLIERLSELAE